MRSINVKNRYRGLCSIDRPVTTLEFKDICVPGQVRKTKDLVYLAMQGAPVTANVKTPTGINIGVSRFDVFDEYNSMTAKGLYKKAREAWNEYGRILTEKNKPKPDTPNP